MKPNLIYVKNFISDVDSFAETRYDSSTGETNSGINVKRQEVKTWRTASS